ncbi:hypothetical protein AAVH_28846 [Aphelenchoides avenae]|nr:hypothetical protein AAVH_28846 [Aphelenchus avenae]
MVFRCHTCDFTTESVERICQHWDAAHKSKHTWLTCPKCAYRSRSMASITDHGMMAHNEVALKVNVRRTSPRNQLEKGDSSLVSLTNNFSKRKGPNILRTDSKRSSVVSKPCSNTGVGNDHLEYVEGQRVTTAPAVSCGSETPELPSALIIDERDDEWKALERQLQQSNKHKEELDKKNSDLAELVKRLEKQLAEKEHAAKEQDALIETLSEENAQLNSDALRHKETQQQLFAQQRELCSQITQQLYAATQCADLTPQSALSLPIQAAMCYVDLLQQSSTQLDCILQTQAPNAGPSLQENMPSCLVSPTGSR